METNRDGKGLGRDTMVCGDPRSLRLRNDELKMKAEGISIENKGKRIVRIDIKCWR